MKKRISKDTTLALESLEINSHNYPELYKAVIDNPAYADQRIAAFVTLKNAGINSQDYLALCQAVIYCGVDHISKMPAILSALKYAKISPKNHPKLCEEAIKNVFFADILPAVFAALKNASISLQDYPELYKAIIKKIYHADKLSAAFVALKNAGISLQDYPELYKAVINKACYADKLAAAFVALKNAGISLQDYPELCEAVINKASCADKLAGVFEKLKAIGVNLLDYHALYLSITQQDYRFYRNSRGICNNAGLRPSLHRVRLGLGPTIEQILEIPVEPDDITNFDLCLDKIKQLDLNASDDFKIIDNALRAGAIGLDILTWLQKNTLQKNQHRYMYEACFLGNTPLVHSPYTFSKVKYQLEDYFKQNLLLTAGNDAYDAQCQAVQQIIDKVRSAHSDITEGPLNKATASLDVQTNFKKNILNPQHAIK